MRISPSNLVLAFLVPAAAGLEWKDLDAPATAQVTSLAAAGKGFLAGTARGRMYLSGDGGGSWSRQNLSEGYPVLAVSAFRDSFMAARSRYYIPNADCWSNCTSISHDSVFRRAPGSTAWKGWRWGAGFGP